MLDTQAPTQEARSNLPTIDVSLAEAAMVYAKLGYHIFPVKTRNKSPLTANGFRDATNAVTEVHAWWQAHPKANIGIAPEPSGLLVFDIDSEEAEAVAHNLGLLDVRTLTVRTGRAESIGRHLYFKHPGGDRIGNPRLGLRGGELVRIDGRTPGLEVKADAGYVVAPPSIHPSGRTYAFEDPTLEVAPLPPKALERLRALMAPVTASAGTGLNDAASSTGLHGEPAPLPSAGLQPDPSVTLRGAEGWLVSLAPERRDNYDDWLKALMALHHQFAGSEHEAEAVALAIQWSQGSGKYKDGDVEDKWGSFGARGTGPEITIRSLKHWAEKDTTYRQGYPRVDCTVPSATRLTRPTWHAIHERNATTPRTFLSNGVLAGLRVRADGTLFIAPFTQDTLAQHLADNVADFHRLIPFKGWVPCYPQQSLVKQLLANPEPPVELPRVRRVVPVPIFAPTGELITTPGYHPASETYYAPPPWLGPLKPVSDRPTIHDVATAVRTFDEHIGTNFPFDQDGGSSRAHALALCLQGFVTDVVDQMCPLFDIEAAQPRTGKGLLTECCLMPAFGPTLAAKRTPMPKTDEEMNKVITALFRDGSPIVAFDNVKGTVDLPSFEATLTAEYFEGRILGSSTMIQGCNRATWVMISNNPDMSGDLAGRAVRIRLISLVEFPADRTDFERLQPMYTRKRLTELIWAMHTLVRHWFAVGCPAPAPGSPGFGSYPRWRHVLGGILHAAGVKGFLLNRPALRQASREETQWRGFMQDWLTRYGTSPVPMSDLLDLAEEHEIEIPGENAKAKATALGMRFGKCVDIPYFDQYTIAKRKKGDVRLWQLVDHGVRDLEVVTEGASI